MLFGGFSRYSRLRRLTFESLERRLCFSVNLAENLTPRNAGEAAQADLLVNNLAISSNGSVQNNPSVAVNPLDPGHVVVAYSDYSLISTGYAGVAVSTSKDGGLTWEHSALTLADGFDQGASDPVAKFDRSGHVYVSFMSATFEGAKRPPILNPASGVQRAMGFESNNGIFVARSDDGGRTWMAPVAVAAHDYDGISKVPFEIYPDMAVDDVAVLPDGQTNPNLGNLYVTWARYYPAGQFPGELDSIGGSDVMIAVSKDSGMTWQTQMQQLEDSDTGETVLQTSSNTGLETAEGFGYLNWSRVAVGATGNVAVADFAGAWFLVNHSDDAAATFNVPGQDSLRQLPFGSGGKLLTAGLSNNQFRTVSSRAIAADPIRPGHLYVAEPLPVFDTLGNPVDAADLFFARSEDFGQSWQSIVIPGSRIRRSVNDDNGGKRSSGSVDDVQADQFMVRLQTNADGDLAVVWYDTRRDPLNHLMDVFGTISTDGGKTFQPNFRVTDVSFDANEGLFEDALGDSILHIGDRIGLAVSSDVAYVAWTDTRAGNQDIYFQNLGFKPPPPALNDRYEPNDSFDQVIDLGSIVSKTLPRLALTAGDTDWFRIESAATGTLTVSLRTSPQVAADTLRLQILDPSGNEIIAESSQVLDTSGQLLGHRASVKTSSGQSFTVRVSGATSNTDYVLDATALTEDLGSLVIATLAGTLQQSDQAYYLLKRLQREPFQHSWYQSNLRLPTIAWNSLMHAI